MKDLIFRNFGFVFKFILTAFFAGMLGEFFRPIYGAAISAIDQTGNFFVNLFYTSAAKISLSTLVCSLANSIIGCLLSLLWTSFIETSKKIEIEKQEKVWIKENTVSLLKKIKFMSISALSIGTLLIVIFYIYLLLPLQLRNHFDHRTTTLRAVIPMEQIYKFNARWCLMRSRKDYLRLMDDLKEIEEKYKDDLELLSSGKSRQCPTQK